MGLLKGREDFISSNTITDMTVLQVIKEKNVSLNALLPLCKVYIVHPCLNISENDAHLLITVHFYCHLVFIEENKQWTISQYKDVRQEMI